MDDRSEMVVYLLDELDELDRLRCERRMQEDPAFRAEVERLRPLLTRLDGLSEEAWEHVDSPHNPEPLPVSPELPVSNPEPPPAPRRRPARRRRRIALRPALLGFAGVAAVAVALLLALTAGSPARHSDTVVLTPLQGAPAGSRATATITGSEHVQLSVEHLPPTGSAHYYELWLMTDTTHLASVASFHVDGHGSARLSLPLPAAPERYRYLNISLQRAGAGTNISSDSLLRGPTARS
jgi:anti-sigma-K factor RskA